MPILPYGDINKNNISSKSPEIKNGGQTDTQGCVISPVPETSIEWSTVLQNNKGQIKKD